MEPTESQTTPGAPDADAPHTAGGPPRAPYTPPTVQTVNAGLLELLGTDIPGCNHVTTSTD